MRTGMLLPTMSLRRRKRQDPRLPHDRSGSSKRDLPVSLTSIEFYRKAAHLTRGFSCAA